MCVHQAAILRMSLCLFLVADKHPHIVGSYHHGNKTNSDTNSLETVSKTFGFMILYQQEIKVVECPMMAGPQEVEILKWMMQPAIYLICERSRQASILTQVVALFRIVESYTEGGSRAETVSTRCGGLPILRTSSRFTESTATKKLPRIMAMESGLTR